MTLRIESGSRWDGLALARYQWSLVEPDLEHWDVYVSLDDEPSNDLRNEPREPLLEWLNERQLERTMVHAPGADILLTRK